MAAPNSPLASVRYTTAGGSVLSTGQWPTKILNSSSTRVEST